MDPIFLISLPRAGSTLLQRILMGHPAIASKSEPWIMLPFIYMLKEDGMVTEYNHRWAQIGVQDFVRDLPRGVEQYNGYLREFVTNLYQANCQPGQIYFLDKTPRYYLIIPELAQIFPQAKFIFLSRNPIQIISSIISTFSHNSLRNLHFYHIDFFKGFDRIAEGIEMLRDRSIHIRYEDLVAQTPATLDKIFGFLNLTWDHDMLHSMDDRGLQGRLGDKWGTYEYKRIADKSIDKWKMVLNERVRKAHITRILERLNAQSLALHGYQKEELLKEMTDLKSRTTWKSILDLNHIVASKLIKFSYLNLYRKRVKVWSKDVIIG